MSVAISLSYRTSLWIRVTLDPVRTSSITTLLLRAVCLMDDPVRSLASSAPHPERGFVAPPALPQQ
jgi:hypothetical protein